MTYKRSIAEPATLPICPFLAPRVAPKIKMRSVATIKRIRSLLVPGKAGIGAITALTPRINKILKTFEPITFPSAISAFFL